MCSSRAQKEAKKAAATLTVSSLGAPCSGPSKSWLVVARSASARLKLVGHLGWVHRQEARAVGQPRERMGGLAERSTAGRDSGCLRTKNTSCQGGGPNKIHHSADLRARDLGGLRRIRLYSVYWMRRDALGSVDRGREGSPNK